MQSENGLLGMGGAPAKGEEDYELINAGKQPVTLLPGGVIFIRQIPSQAFASQSLAVLRHFRIPDDASHVNAHGVAIALGHPLRMSGARLALTLVHSLCRTGGRLGVATLCVGVGQGLALEVERV